MVKQLFLVRHAEASNNSSQDISRPLTPEGHRIARHLGNWLAESDWNINKVFSSNAERALDTANAITEALKMSRVNIESELYEASVRTFLGIVNQTEDSIDQALFVAHNPAITYLAEYITGEPVPAMEPGSLSIITFAGINWNMVGEKTGSLNRYLSPAEL